VSCPAHVGRKSPPTDGLALVFHSAICTLSWISGSTVGPAIKRAVVLSMINAISNTPNVWTVSRGAFVTRVFTQNSDEPHLRLGLPLQVASSISRSLLGQPGGSRHRHRVRQHDLSLPPQAEPQTRGRGTHGQFGSHRNSDLQRFQVPSVRPEDLYVPFIYQYAPSRRLFCILFAYRSIVSKTPVGRGSMSSVPMSYVLCRVTPVSYA
jgi:hypothetical protein